MKRLMIITATVALAILVDGAPVTWAGERSPLSAITSSDRAAAPSPMISPPSASAPETALGVQECERGLGTPLDLDPSAGCNFGAPRCSYSGQCDTWCFPLMGTCVASCCACS